MPKKSKKFSWIAHILLPIVVIAAVVGIVYLLLVYNSEVNVFFNSPLNLMIAVALMCVFSTLIVIINMQSANVNAKADSSAADENTEEKEEPRFGKLMAVDAAMKKYKAPNYNNDVSLEKFCNDFRNYAAGELGLFYSLETVRSLIAGLATNKLIIMQGISGTGKTSLTWALGEFIGRPSSIIPVQPSWREKSDLVGYYNEFTHKFNETEFLKVLYEASYTDDVCITLLDEMNISRVEYYFAEFLSLLELKQTDKWMIDIVSSAKEDDPVKIIDGRFKLPENMWYIGTANNDDSTMAISDKVYDRAMVIDLNNRAVPFTAQKTDSIRLSYSYFKELVEEAKKAYSLSESGQSKIRELDEYLISHLGITFGNRIMMQIEDFVPVFISCGGTENEAIDIILSRKVLRKLETKNPLFVKREAEGLLSFMNELFGNGTMNNCVEVLKKYDI